MFITPSFKKSLSVEQFQGNYLNVSKPTGNRAYPWRVNRVSRSPRFRLCSPEIYAKKILCNNHNATDMQLIPLELVKSNRGSVRKAREAYLIERGQTLEPHGLNKKDETLY